MPVVPANARWAAAAAAAVFILPILLGELRALGVLRIGPAWPSYLLLPGADLLGAAGCAVPLCFRRPERFRAACVVAGAIAACLWLPTLAIGTLASLAFGAGLAWAFIHVALATAGTATLVAAFQRSEGAERGGRAVVVGSVAAALALTGWMCAALG